MRPGGIRRACLALSLAVGLAVSASACHGDASSQAGGDSASTTADAVPGNARADAPPHASGAPPREGDADGNALSGVRASVVQQRIDEGTRHIAIEISVDAHTSLHVVAVQLRSAGFRPVAATSKDTSFAPRQVIDLSTVYGRPLCDEDPTADLSAVLTVEESSGSDATYEVPVTGGGVGLIRRLHAAECAQLRLRQAASLSYGDFGRDRVDGVEVLAGALELERPDHGGSGDVVLIKSLSGSVLFEFRPVAKTAPRYVARLARDADRLRLPVVIASNDRCDPHARSQSTQTFLFSVYVRVGSAAEYRQILVPPRQLQRQSLAFLDDVC